MGVIPSLETNTSHADIMCYTATDILAIYTGLLQTLDFQYANIDLHSVSYVKVQTEIFGSVSIKNIKLLDARTSFCITSILLLFPHLRVMNPHKH